MENTRGKYGDTMGFHLKTQLRVEICFFFFNAFTLSKKAVAVFAEKE